MRISARCDYACRALLELSLNWPSKEPLQIKKISEAQDIPMRYLVQILIQLKRLGLVNSIRGKQGGYVLSKSPAKIKLSYILKQIGGPLLQLSDTAEKSDSVFKGVWEEVEEAIEKILDNSTFEDIVQKLRAKKKVVVYQI